MKIIKIKVANKLDHLGLSYLDEDKWVYLKVEDEFYHLDTTAGVVYKLLDYVGYLDQVCETVLHLKDEILCILSYPTYVTIKESSEGEFHKVLIKELLITSTNKSEVFTIPFKRTDDRMAAIQALRILRDEKK